MNLAKNLLIAGAAAIAANAHGAVNITRPASLPVYSTTLNFDEPGGPTGPVPTTSWSAIGLSTITTGVGSLPNVANWATAYGVTWLGSANSVYGSFGMTLTFDSDLSALAANYWDTSSTFSPIGGGGCRIRALNNGVEVASLFINNPTFTMNENPRIDIQATDGAVFDTVEFAGFGFTPDAFLDNISWTAVPAPGAALLPLVGLAGLRRRRA
ncbi:MAG TPA: hypothetical protein VG797_01135 [Phycisphaerales bacterium]|nr:hypothetical protein [Phycisphaerales bacterium]